MATEVEGRVNASLLSVLYESWEKYVRALYGKMLFRLRDKVSLPSRQAFHTRTSMWRKYRNTAKYFGDYAAFACRSECSEAFKAFRNGFDWSLVHVKRWPGHDIEWMEVPKALAFCRNCIVHNDGRVSEVAFQRLNKRLREYVQPMMSTTILSDEERILPDARTMDGLAEAMASIAYGLYVLISKRCSLEVEYDLWNNPD